MKDKARRYDPEIIARTVRRGAWIISAIYSALILFVVSFIDTEASLKVFLVGFGAYVVFGFHSAAKDHCKALGAYSA